MGTKKKKSGKPKRLQKNRGHYCKICGEHKANEKFSGRGHATHICKACASKSPAQKSEDMTINRLHGMAFRYLNESEMKWLKNRRNDSRPEVQELARQVFDEKFPRQARNEIKAQLHIENMVFRVHGEVFDNYGDEYRVNAEFAADTTGKIVKKQLDDNDGVISEESVDIGAKAIRKFFNVAVHNYDVSFWEADFCQGDIYDPDIDDGFDDLDDEEEPPDDRIFTWSVEIEYKNGTGQAIKGYEYIPDPVIELFDDFNDYFDDGDSLDDEFNDDDEFFTEN